MLLKHTQLLGGLCLLFGFGTATAQTPAPTFAASTNHSVSISPDGSLWAWGLNYEGQLGNGTATSSAAPVQVLPEARNTRWAQVATGTSHTLALTTDGRLHAWGSNHDGQLGDGTKAGHLSPVVVPLPASAARTTWKQVAAGTSHSLALTADGRLFAWGNNNNGQVGNGSSLDCPVPAEVALPASAKNTTWAQVAAGSAYSLGLTADGQLFAWGTNDHGQLGDGSNMTRLQPVAVALPKKLAGLRWASVAAGRHHVLALTTQGQAYVWGSNRYGQLGSEHYTALNRPTPLDLPGKLAGTTWSQVAAGDAHSLALSTDGRLVAWGNNCMGQLGDGSNLRRLRPTVVALPQNLAAAGWGQITSGSFHTLARTADGNLYTWGNNGFGQLGDGSTKACCSPALRGVLLTASALPAPANDQFLAAGANEPWGLNDTRLSSEMPAAPVLELKPCQSAEVIL
jgi:alpha-tubulin suppressor-like RCC1 family protein